ncbi:MAG: PorT family protein [Flavobacteriales bacterium]|nr:PorT family protein [Flavobacteriales bacterium]
MSGQHWIDAFFRKRLKEQSFPVEAGEFEDMRALLEQRNAATGVVRTGLSKWWLSALIPVAGMVWWVIGGNGGAERDVAPSAQQNTVGTDTGEQHAEAASHIDRGDGTGPSDPLASKQDVSPASLVPSTTHTDEEVPRAEAGAGGMRSTGASPSGTHAADAAQRTGRAEAHGHIANTTLQERSESEVSPTSPDMRVDDTMSGSAHVRQFTTQEMIAAGSAEAERSEEASTATPDVVGARSDAGMVSFMELRRAAPLAAAPEPITREVPMFEQLPLGALHFFGAPLAVRTRTAAGERSGAETGSLFGLEYRIRAKRFVWATGIHYGSYALKADQGTTDVKLNFVEVPVLAGYRFSQGRLGFLVQGGVSVDLLFNARGQYRIEGDRAGSAFPDDAFHTTNLSLQLRPQASYQVNEYLSVNAGPLWKAQMSGVAKEGPLDGARMSSSGVSLGLSWQLERTTY